MRYWKESLAACLLALGIGCGNGSDANQISSSGSTGNRDEVNYGSATDVSRGAERTNDAINSGDNGIGGPMQRASGNYQSNPMIGKDSDAELAKKIKVALTTGSMGTTGVLAENQLTKIDVSVTNGIVTLRGGVSSEDEKRTVEKQVAGMGGVAGVKNLLSVGGRIIQGSTIDPIVPRGPGNE